MPQQPLTRANLERIYNLLDATRFIWIDPRCELPPLVEDPRTTRSDLLVLDLENSDPFPGLLAQLEGCHDDWCSLAWYQLTPDGTAWRCPRIRGWAPLSAI